MFLLHTLVIYKLNNQMMNRPSYTTYTKLGPRQRDINPKTKMIVLLLKRFTNRALNDYFGSFKNHSLRYSQKIKRMEKIQSTYMQLCLLKAWGKLKHNIPKMRSKERILKDIMILTKRIQQGSIRYCFDKLHKNVYVSNTNSFERILAARGNIMFQALRKVSMNKKKSAWFKLNSNSLKKRLSKRLMVVNFIIKSVRRRHLLESWNRITIYGKQTTKEDSKIMENLQLQVQDLKIQVQNKNANITRLQDQICELKQHSSYKAPQSNSFIYYANNNRSYAGLQKSSRSNKFNSSFDKDSNDGSLAKDPSFGSLLGGSFVSYRSKGSLSKANMNDSNASKNNCNCGYRERYEKYKATNETLKKQLQIIKTELQFTKDMNEHMQNEIRVHLGDSEKDQKIDKLRQDLKESQKQKDALKEKVLKYEKYVNKLKMQFKTKIEEIYRRVKKSS